MLFNSLAFAFFLPIVFAIYWAIPDKFRWPVLLCASYYFYMSWNVKYVVLILFTTIISYVAAIFVEKAQSLRIKRFVLLCSAVLSLGVLFYFKYFNFFIGSLEAVMSLFAIKLSPISINVILPVGISFYTFQTLSYVIDVYKGTVKAERNLGIYATFISFFPQLVAGPIERTSNLLPQIKEKKKFDYETATYGLKLMAWGFFKKLAIADVLSGYVDRAYFRIGEMPGLDYAFAIFFFSIQIYCDFSGYSDIAIGTAKLLGIDLMTNFKSPYLSDSIKEFWSRWHISLSTWFRDYVYIPLGGNRCKPIRNIFNMMVTFLVSGLWHGASWTFVVWGGIHGFIQIIEKCLSEILSKFRSKNRITRLISILVVFVICNLAWVFFRADSIYDAFRVIGHAIVDIRHPHTYFHTSLGLGKQALMKIFITLIVLFIYDNYALKEDPIVWIGKQKGWFRWMVYVCFVFLILINMPASNENAFIYFQF